MPFDERGSILGQSLPGGRHFEQLVPLLACHALSQTPARTRNPPETQQYWLVAVAGEEMMARAASGA